MGRQVTVFEGVQCVSRCLIKLITVCVLLHSRKMSLSVSFPPCGLCFELFLHYPCVRSSAMPQCQQAAPQTQQRQRGKKSLLPLGSNWTVGGVCTVLEGFWPVLNNVNIISTRSFRSTFPLRMHVAGHLKRLNAHSLTSRYQKY